MKKNENNFRKAVNELLNMDSSGTKSGGEKQESQNIPSGNGNTEPEVEVAAPSPSVFVNRTDVLDKPNAPERPNWETVITQDVIIDGNIISGSNLKILGQVQGNVSCEGTVVLTGSVNGDLSANSLKFQTGSVHGNITVHEDMLVEKQTIVKGDVTAGNAVFGGHAEGSFSIRDNLELRETASIIGNIKATGIVMYNGSRVRGMLDIGGELENIDRGSEE